MALFWTAEPWK